MAENSKDNTSQDYDVRSCTPSDLSEAELATCVAAGWRWPTRSSRKCLKHQRPALVVAGRRRLRSRRSRVRIAAGASKDQAPAGFVGASPSYGKTVAETLAKHTPRRRGRVPCADARVTRSLSAVR